MNQWKNRIRRTLALAMTLSLIGGGADCLSSSAASEEPMASAELAAEEVDLSEWLLQEGGLPVWPEGSGTMSALEGGSKARATANENLEAARQAILQAAREWKKDIIDLKSFNIEKTDLHKLFTDVINRNPEFFYIKSFVTWGYKGSSVATGIEFVYREGYTQAHVAEYKAALEKAYAESITDEGMSKFQKARALHDYLVQHMHYDSASLADDIDRGQYTAYNALVKGTAVCNGYALAYIALLNKAGIESGYCISKAINHAWNYIKLDDGNWYHVDVTWDDPTPDKVGAVRYKYFLCSDAQMKSEKKADGTPAGHYTWDEDPDAPVCGSTTYDNADWKTLQSGIFYVNGSEYYLREEGTFQDHKLSLMRRRDAVETTVCSVPAVWKVPNPNSEGNFLYYNRLYSGLSLSGGNLYFNSHDTMYAVALGSNTPKKIYSYTGSGSIYGSFACEGRFVMGIAAGPSLTQTLKEVITLGWSKSGGRSYWYEDGVKQGTYSDAKGVLGDGTVRGREIYDPGSKGWYWLDACYEGAKACSKEVWMPYVYQQEKAWDKSEVAANAKSSGDMAAQIEKAIREGTGKWVRYDADGKMRTGWYTVSGADAAVYPGQNGNTYYYDPVTGMMARGYVTIDGVRYHFDEATGIRD